MEAHTPEGLGLGQRAEAHLGRGGESWLSSSLLKALGLFFLQGSLAQQHLLSRLQIVSRFYSLVEFSLSCCFLKKNQPLCSLKLILYKLEFFLAVVSLHCCVQASSSCGEQGLLLVAVVGFLLQWLLSVWSIGSRHRAEAVVALRHVGSSQTRDGSGVSCIARQILNHWTTREAPDFV